MLLAGDRLKTLDEPISDVASTLGYESESAFGKAFKRVMGCSPGQYSRRSHLALPSPTAIEPAYGDRREVAAVG
jgi:AraC-like DNA-binding protein